MQLLCTSPLSSFSFFFFNDTATTEIYTLSLHDALPISRCGRPVRVTAVTARSRAKKRGLDLDGVSWRSEEHTSELQSQFHLVCRLLLEKKKKKPKHVEFIQNNISLATCLCVSLYTDSCH